MGLGVMDPNGLSPAVTWQLRVRYLDSVRLQVAAMSLLTGQETISNDDGVQVNWIGGDAPRGIIRLRDSAARVMFFLDVVLNALSMAELASCSTPDDRGAPHPTPDVWMRVTSSTTVHWELFNCRIESVILKY